MPLKKYRNQNNSKEDFKYLKPIFQMRTRPNILIANNSTIIKGCSAINCFGGLIIGHHEKPIGGFFAMDGISRYLGSNKEALKFEKESLQRSDV